MDNGHIVEIHNLVKRFPVGNGFFTALQDVTLAMATGEFTGLVGPSGSGKTTLLNIMGGLDIPTEGSVTVLDLPLKGQNHKTLANLRRDSIGFIFQTYNLLPVYSVFENIEFPLLLLDMPVDDRKRAVNEAMEWVGLSDKAESRPAQLSGGESQRVAIARAIVKRPRLVIADEPTANLDAANSHNVMGILAKLNRELSTTFIFATHDEKVMGYLSRIVHLVDGKLDREEIVESPPHLQEQ
ncbi:MAG: ABC transporter ATP-binding protein [Candidatus Marinimicrobia bacterium]|nr:ABC transporter ATP-binding protein [Candidatus Neomarinimicrobiota bacterium]